MSYEQFHKLKQAFNISFATLGWFSISVSFTIYNKWFMQQWKGGFDYPILMTCLHMCIKVLITRTWAIYLYYTKFERIQELNWDTTLQLVYPIGILTAIDVMLSNLSILYIPLSLYVLGVTLLRGR